MVEPLKPFTAQHVKDVTNALRHINEARILIAKHKSCGKDCQQEEELADYLEETLTKFRAEFLEPIPTSLPNGGQ